VPAKDPAALADAIGHLINRPDLRLRLGEEGRAFVARNYDWEHNAEQMRQLYDSLTSL
jgi:glycosyltransferase involved in cell wall biosynthesis